MVGERKVWLVYSPRRRIEHLFAAAIKNVRTLRTLAEKLRIMAAMSQLSRMRIKESAKKSRVESSRWIRLPEFLELAPRGELKEFIPLA